MANDSTSGARFTVRELPYAYDALAPQLSEETLRYHHDKHYAGYVAKLNELILDTPYEGQPLEDIILAADGAVYNNAAQHFIIDNLDAILTAENMQTEMQGAPWTKDHDDCLIDLYKKSVPVSEIAITLKRSASAVRGRLKKLGFDA